MFNSLMNMVGLDKTDYSQLVKDGAIILDVRTKAEYSSGHIKNSINIEVGQLKSSLDRLGDKEKKIITCCASGIRSSTAKSILESNGHKNVYNGGGWKKLNQKLS